MLKTKYMEEIWKDIEGYEGLYQVSNLGRIMSLGRTVYRSNGKVMCYMTYKSHIMRLAPHKCNGCFQVQVGLYSEYTGKKDQTLFFVSRLVAKAFFTNSLNYPDVIHLDGDSTNNKATNLKWGTMLKVMKRMKKNDQRGMPNRKLTDRQVLAIRKLYKAKWLDMEYTDIAKIYNVTSSCIGHIIRRHTHINL
jgi:hypothetical protein